MAKIAYCSGCGRYIELTYTGECPEGHPRSALRDVREGTLASAPSVRVATVGPTAEEAAFREFESPFAKIVGRAIIIVPIVAVLGFGLVTGMVPVPGFGMSLWERLGWSVFSLAMTVGGAFFFVRLRRH